MDQSGCGAPRATARDTNRDSRRGTMRRRAHVEKPHVEAVHPGFEGGQYRPLSERDIERIYDTALKLLEEVGIGEPIPEILQYAIPGGCILGDDGRLRFPRALVEDLIAASARRYTLFAPDPALDLEVHDRSVLFTTSG